MESAFTALWIILGIWACFSLGFGFGREWYPNEDVPIVGLIGFLSAIGIAFVLCLLYEASKAVINGWEYLYPPKEEISLCDKKERMVT
ncbi:MAG: hypothetical protein LBD11_02095 [Candidatus Peribacteria bacterium]|jgi:hypothetical protein|nr:hypothetical protein [Candidatus Peribacteria bacterium]